MRLIRRLVVLAIIGGGSVAAYNYWSDHGWPLRSRAATLDTADVKQEAARLATRASAKASVAASQVGVTMSASALTAKIKAKMALDDLVKARSISVETSGTVVTLSGRVGSAAERDRAVRLAQETAGVTRVVNRLEVAR
jgi:hyperosmotically inducible protein